ncbi:hypothetical protein B0H14DRAFT_3564713 [Mycena olivaceomarginata]|nr:hypothetical protein B0H14DRAFT_3564713 [Mycena olivaceomarginata]
MSGNVGPVRSMSGEMLRVIFWLSYQNIYINRQLKPPYYHQNIECHEKHTKVWRVNVGGDNEDNTLDALADWQFRLYSLDHHVVTTSRNNQTQLRLPLVCADLLESSGEPSAPLTVWKTADDSCHQGFAHWLPRGLTWHFWCLNACLSIDGSQKGLSCKEEWRDDALAILFSLHLLASCARIKTEFVWSAGYLMSGAGPDEMEKQRAQVAWMAGEYLRFHSAPAYANTWESCRTEAIPDIFFRPLPRPEGPRPRTHAPAPTPALGSPVSHPRTSTTLPRHHLRSRRQRQCVHGSPGGFALGAGVGAVDPTLTGAVLQVLLIGANPAALAIEAMQTMCVHRSPGRPRPERGMGAVDPAATGVALQAPDTMGAALHAMCVCGTCARCAGGVDAGHNMRVDVPGCGFGGRWGWGQGHSSITGTDARDNWVIVA